MAQIDELKRLLEINAQKFYVVFHNVEDIKKAKRLLISHVRDILVGAQEKSDEIVILFFDDISKSEVVDSVSKVLAGADIKATIRDDKEKQRVQ